MMRPANQQLCSIGATAGVVRARPRGSDCPHFRNSFRTPLAQHHVPALSVPSTATEADDLSELASM